MICHLFEDGNSLFPWMGRGGGVGRDLPNSRFFRWEFCYKKIIVIFSGGRKYRGLGLGVILSDG